MQRGDLRALLILGSRSTPCCSRRTLAVGAVFDGDRISWFRGAKPPVRRYPGGRDLGPIAVEWSKASNNLMQSDQCTGKNS